MIVEPVRFSDTTGTPPTQLSQFKELPVAHTDQILDVAYNYYGNLVATTGADHYVRISENVGGNWVLIANTKSHSGPIFRVTWANPEFGNVLATCSFDKTVRIWELLYTEGQKCELVKRSPGTGDTKSPIVDIRFSPKSVGLIVLTVTIEGAIHLSECPDPSQLASWQAVNQIYQVGARCSSAAWSEGSHHPTLIAVGINGPSPRSGNVVLFRYESTAIRLVELGDIPEESKSDPVNDLQFAPNLGRSFHLLAVAGEDSVRIVKIPLEGVDAKVVANLTHDKTKVWRVSWNVTGTVLCTAHDGGVVCLWSANHLGAWGSVGTRSNLLREAVVT